MTVTITKSMVCRASVTIAATVVIVAIGWWLIHNAPKITIIIPDLPWDYIVGYSITAIGIVFLWWFFAYICWRDGFHKMAVAGILLIGGLCMIPTIIPPTNMDETQVFAVSLFLLIGVSLLIELVALCSYEYIAKRTCKIILGNGQ